MAILVITPPSDWRDALQRTADAKRAAIEKSSRLEPLAGTFVWSGKILPGALGRGSPAAEMSGRTEASWVNDGLYLLIQGDYRYRVEDLSGSFWKFDYFLGYDPFVKRYRQWLADNVGLAIKDCTLDGTRLRVDFPADARIESGGHTIIFRQAYHWNEPNIVGGRPALTPRQKIPAARSTNVRIASRLARRSIQERSGAVLTRWPPLSRAPARRGFCRHTLPAGRSIARQNG